VNRRLGNQLEEVKSIKRKLKIVVDLNTLFENVDGIKKALEEASKIKAEAVTGARRDNIGCGNKEY
jgi:hypothetical protein